VSYGKCGAGQRAGQLERDRQAEARIEYVDESRTRGIQQRVKRGEPNA